MYVLALSDYKLSTRRRVAPRQACVYDIRPRVLELLCKANAIELARIAEP